MVKITFTENLARHVKLTTLELQDGTIAEVIEQLFGQYPMLKPYIFDEQNKLRKHVMLAIDKQLLQGDLSSHLKMTGFKRLHIMQALSGG